MENPPKIPFYDPLAHPPEQNQGYLLTLIEELRSLLIEMEHDEDETPQHIKATRSMLLAAVSTAKNLLEQ